MSSSTARKIKVVVVGNCQARPFARMFCSLNADIEITATVIVHLVRSEQFGEYREHFEAADIIVSQLVLDTYPCEFVRTSFLKSVYGNKVVSIVNLYFSGYTPDWFYIRIPKVGPLKGPMGDYHNRTILHAWQNKELEEVAAARVEDKIYNSKYLPEVDSSLQQLRKREERVDVSITDFIQKQLRKRRLFFTMNHPSIFLIKEYAKRVLKKRGIKARRDFFFFRKAEEESLDQFIPLLNPGVDLPQGDEVVVHKGVEYQLDEDKLVTIAKKVRGYSTPELVTCFYEIYEKYDLRLGLRNVDSEKR